MCCQHLQRRPPSPFRGPRAHEHVICSGRAGPKRVAAAAAGPYNSGRAQLVGGATCASPPTISRWGRGMDDTLRSRPTSKTMSKADQNGDPGVLRAFEEFAETRVFAGLEDRPDRAPLIDPNSKRARRKHTLTWQEIPAWQQDNEYILTGYRRCVHIASTGTSDSPIMSCSRRMLGFLPGSAFHEHGARIWPPLFSHRIDPHL